MSLKRGGFTRWMHVRGPCPKVSLKLKDMHGYRFLTNCFWQQSMGDSTLECPQLTPVVTLSHAGPTNLPWFSGRYRGSRVGRVGIACALKQL